MQEDCCFFIGHRDSPPEIYPQIVQSIETLIHKHQVLHFVVGGYGAFDRMVAKALIEQKKKIPGIILSYLTPYHPTNNSAKKPEGFDEIYYPDGMESVPARYAIVKANQKMIRQSKKNVAPIKHSTKWRRWQALDISILIASFQMSLPPSFIPMDKANLTKSC